MCNINLVIKLCNTLLFVEYNYNMEQSEFLNQVYINYWQDYQTLTFLHDKKLHPVEFLSTVTASFV